MPRETPAADEKHNSGTLAPGCFSSVLTALHEAVT